MVGWTRRFERQDRELNREMRRYRRWRAQATEEEKAAADARFERSTRWSGLYPLAIFLPHLFLFALLLVGRACRLVYGPVA